MPLSVKNAEVLKANNLVYGEFGMLETVSLGL